MMLETNRIKVKHHLNCPPRSSPRASSERKMKGANKLIIIFSLSSFSSHLDMFLIPTALGDAVMNSKGQAAVSRSALYTIQPAEDEDLGGLCQLYFIVPTSKNLSLNPMHVVAADDKEMPGRLVTITPMHSEDIFVHEGADVDIRFDDENIWMPETDYHHVITRETEGNWFNIKRAPEDDGYYIFLSSMPPSALPPPLPDDASTTYLSFLSVQRDEVKKINYVVIGGAVGYKFKFVEYNEEAV